jgi:hypothetical protein
VLRTSCSRCLEQNAYTRLQSIIASFFYVGALNEGLGHGGRVAKFLNSASTVASKPTDNEALVLKRGTKVAGRRPSSRRESSAVEPSCAAEFSQVTVTNPFNVTLIRDLSMTVISLVVVHVFATTILHFPSHNVFSPIHFHRLRTVKAASSPGLLAAGNLPYCASWASCGPLQLVPFAFHNTLARMAFSFYRSVRGRNARLVCFLVCEFMF